MSLAVPAVIGVVAASAGVWLLVRAVRWRRNPAERERRRRIHVHVNGRTTEVLIYRGTETDLHYRYQISGVAYDTSQDITALRPQLPREPEKLIGSALAKYDPRNPYNSIVVCEHWSGFQKAEGT
jgi:hypothetical protein